MDPCSSKLCCSQLNGVKVFEDVIRAAGASRESPDWIWLVFLQEEGSGHACTGGGGCGDTQGKGPPGLGPQGCGEVRSSACGTGAMAALPHKYTDICPVEFPMFWTWLELTCSLSPYFPWKPVVRSGAWNRSWLILGEHTVCTSYCVTSGGIWCLSVSLYGIQIEEWFQMLCHLIHPLFISRQHFT